MRAITTERAERCPTKRVYGSWHEAETAARLLIDDLRDGKLAIQKGPNVYAYRCSECDRWHVGHTPRPRHPFIKEYRP